MVYRDHIKKISRRRLSSLASAKRVLFVSITIAKITWVLRLQLISYMDPSTMKTVGDVIPLLPDRLFVYLMTVALTWLLWTQL